MLTMVFTASMAAADASSSSTSAMTSCFHGIETAQPRIRSPRTPAMASAMSDVVNDL